MGKSRERSNIVKLAPKRRGISSLLIAGGVMLGAMFGLAILFMSPAFLARADTLPHIIMKDVAAAQGKPCGYVAVHDGDTFRCDRKKIRLVAAAGPLDAPELSGSPRCDAGRGGWCDQALAEASRDRLSELLRQDGLTIECEGNDRYGRALCRAAVGGRDVGDTLVAERLAVIRNDWRR